MRHATAETHTSLLQAVLGLIAAAGTHFRADVRAALRTEHVNPVIELVKPPTGMTIRPDGVVVIPFGGPPAPQTHIRWRIGSFNLVPFESLDPVTDYQNGLQIVSSDGVLSGHAHLHVMKLADAADVSRAASGVPGVTMPASYQFFGGHNWYRSSKNQDGTAFLDALTLPRLELGETYMMKLELVHVDDTQITPAKHGQFVGSLTTIFIPVAPTPAPST